MTAFGIQVTGEPFLPNGIFQDCVFQALASPLRRKEVRAT